MKSRIALLTFFSTALLAATACSPTQKNFNTDEQRKDESYQDGDSAPAPNSKAAVPVNSAQPGNGSVSPDAAGRQPGMPPEEVAEISPEDVVLPAGVFRAITDEEFIHAAALKEGEEQMAILCERNKDKQNIIVQKFCVEKIRPKSIAELQEALGLRVPPDTGRGDNGDDGIPGYAIQGHSSSLVGQFVSAINPRVIIFNSQDPENDDDGFETNNFVAMGFVRGEQFAELFVGNQDSDPMTYDANEDPDLFLVAFKQACNDKPEGCNPGELLTPAVESNWTSFTIYQDEDLKNTIVDCRHCHQPEGLNSPIFGRMQELRGPWNHFMRDNRDNGNALLDDYFAAHGMDEIYGGIPGSSIAGSDPANLEDFIRSQDFNDLQVPDIEYNSRNILREIEDNNDNEDDNSVAAISETWEALYQQAATGQAGDGKNIIPIPYHSTRVTEPSLLEKYTAQYQDFKAGNISLDQFEDHRHIFKVDHRQRADMGFAVREGTAPEVMLIQACAQCHNSKLDDSISRSRFNVDFAAMGAIAKTEIDIAIQRLKLGYSPERLKQEGMGFVNPETLQPMELEKGEHIKTMPPRRFKSLTDAQIDALIAYMKAEQAKLP